MALKVRKNRSPKPPAGCPVSACMEVIGGAWTANIIWYLAGGPRRFSELRVDISGVSAKMLTARLRELEERGIVTRSVLPTSPPSVEYALTELGQELVPAINAIVEVGYKLKEGLAECPPRSADRLSAGTAPPAPGAPTRGTDRAASPRPG